jgi:hypothetical protein
MVSHVFKDILLDLFLNQSKFPLTSLSLFVCLQAFFLVLKSQRRFSATEQVCVCLVNEDLPFSFPFCLYLASLTLFFDRPHFPVHAWSHPYRVDHFSTPTSTIPDLPCYSLRDPSSKLSYLASSGCPSEADLGFLSLLFLFLDPFVSGCISNPFYEQTLQGPSHWKVCQETCQPLNTTPS